MNATQNKNEWLYTISSKHKLINLNLWEIWNYRDLLFLFVKRDIITYYKQTVLGPLWYLLQPLFTSLIFTLIFNNLADIPTGEGVPNFYSIWLELLLGIILKIVLLELANF